MGTYDYLWLHVTKNVYSYSNSDCRYSKHMYVPIIPSSRRFTPVQCLLIEISI